MEACQAAIQTHRRGLETGIASVIGYKHLKDVHTAKRQAQTLLSRELAERYRHGRAAVLDFRIEIGFWTALHLGVRGPWYQTGAHTCSYEASCERLKCTWYQQSDRIAIEPGYCSLIDAFGACIACNHACSAGAQAGCGLAFALLIGARVLRGGPCWRRRAPSGLCEPARAGRDGGPARSQ
jgi:hypothetical protein